MYFYLKQLQSVSLAIRSLCLGVVKISFYIRHFTFYLYSLQNNCPMVYDARVRQQKVAWNLGLKERVLNYHLRTHNFIKEFYEHLYIISTMQ